MQEQRDAGRFGRTMLSWVMAGGLLIFAGCGGGQEENGTASVSVPEKAAPQEADGAAESSAADGAAEKEQASEAETAETGTLTGQIIYEGEYQAPPPLVTMGEKDVKNADVCAHDAVPDESLQVDADGAGGLANVFVYLGRAPSGAPEAPAPDEPVVFDQKGCRFVPHALLVRVGQPVLVKSDDPIPHNTHTLPVRNTAFNQTMEGNNREGIELVYRRSEAEPVRVKCDIHPWMAAYHLPLDHPFGAVTDAEGRFTIEELPAGKHKIRVWHERAGFLERQYEVEVQPGETTEITLAYPAAKFSAD